MSDVSIRRSALSDKPAVHIPSIIHVHIYWRYASKNVVSLNCCFRAIFVCPSTLRVTPAAAAAAAAIAAMLNSVLAI